MQSNTTEEAIQYVTDKSFYNYLCNIIKQRCEQYVKQALKVDMVLFSESEGLLGQAVAWLDIGDRGIASAERT